MCSKLNAHFPTIKELIEEFEKDAKCKDLPPPKWDWEQMKKGIADSHDRLMRILANCMPGLASLEQKESAPDQFGRAYSTVCQDCFDSLAEKRADRFIALFPLLFDASFKAHGKLGKMSEPLQPTSAFVLTLEPLLDIQSLSGYAMLYSELLKMPEAWESCRATWDSYLQSCRKPQGVVKYLVDTYQIRSRIFQISPRDILRTSWEMRFHKELRRMGLIEPSGPWDREPKVKHQSPLIRALCRGGFEPHVPPAEVFFVTYLLKKPESAGIEFKDRWDLDEDIKEEEQRE